MTVKMGIKSSRSTNNDNKKRGSMHSNEHQEGKLKPKTKRNMAQYMKGGVIHNYGEVSGFLVLSNARNMGFIISVVV